MFTVSFEKEKNISVSYLSTFSLLGPSTTSGQDIVSKDEAKKKIIRFSFTSKYVLGRLVAKDASSAPPRRELGAVRADTNLVSLNAP